MHNAKHNKHRNVTYIQTTVQNHSSYSHLSHFMNQFTLNIDNNDHSSRHDNTPHPVDTLNCS